MRSPEDKAKLLPSSNDASSNPMIGEGMKDAPALGHADMVSPLGRGQHR